MRTRFALLAVAAAFVVGAIAQDGVARKQPRPNPPEQAKRGRELFMTSSKGKPCGTCHMMDGVGEAVGPDLTKMATYAMPRGLVIAMRMSMAETVQQVKAGEGPAFPAVLKQKEGDSIEVWDLSQMPPVLRKYKAADIQSMKRDEKWKHPPTQAGYDGKELADLVGFLKWASTGSTKVVSTDEVEYTQ